MSNIPINDLVLIKSFCALWRGNSKTTSNVLSNTIPKFLQSVGTSEVMKIKALVDPQKISDYISKNYKYCSDPLKGSFNVVFPSWFTALIKMGDCDCLANLVRDCIPGGKTWALVEGLSNSDNAGHVIYIDSHWNVFSNGKLEANEMDIRRIAKRYVKHCKYAIEIFPDITHGEIITL
jgi:hypothetical protein